MTVTMCLSMSSLPLSWALLEDKTEKQQAAKLGASTGKKIYFTEDDVSSRLSC